jgi:glycosyltransferase involved in cell wall biosynthesis
MTVLVTMITATWGRPKTILKHAIPSIQRQDYPEIEHLIIPDGYDPVLNEVLANAGYSPGGYRKRLVWLGRNWTGFSGDGGIGAIPRLVGSYLAAGEYIGYLDDDNDLTPDHVSKLVHILENQGKDIALSPWEDWPDASSHIADTNTFLHRAAVLKRGSWGLDGYTGDSRLVNRWIDNGASWGYHDDRTVTLNRHNGGKGAPD